MLGGLLEVAPSPPAAAEPPAALEPVEPVAEVEPDVDAVDPVEPEAEVAELDEPEAEVAELDEPEVALDDDPELPLEVELVADGMQNPSWQVPPGQGVSLATAFWTQVWSPVHDAVWHASVAMQSVSWLQLAQVSSSRLHTWSRPTHWSRLVAVHWTQAPVRRWHAGVLPPQSESSWQPWQVWLARSQTGVLSPQSVWPRQATQVLDAGSQRGVAPPH